MQVESSGTQAATIGVEHELAAPAAADTRVLLVDVAALVEGDTVELRINAPVLSGGTTRLVKLQRLIGAQGEPHTQSPPIVMPQGGTFTLKQTSGTGRSFPWAIVTLG